MGIIVSKNARGARRLEPSGYLDEAYLQDYIARNPGVLPFDELDGGDRFLVVAREVETASGPIDAVGIDAAGNVYLIETKLFRNPDKRHVLAQVIDYGAALWKHHADRRSFRDCLEAAARATFDQELAQRVGQELGLDEGQVAELLDGADLAVQEGRFRFVVLMDRLDERLKTLISFINENASFDVLAVETEFYRFEEYEVTIPRLHGVVARKAGPSSARRTGHWDEATFFAALAAKVTPEQLAAARTLFSAFVEHADSVRFGTGAVLGSYLPTYSAVGRRSVVTANTDGSIYLNFGWCFEGDQLHPAMRALAAEIRARCPELSIPEPALDKYHSLKIEHWAPCVDRLIEAVRAALPQQRRS